MKDPALRSRWWRWPVAPLVCFGLAALLAETGMMERIEWRTLDWRTRIRAHFQPAPQPGITVVLYEDTTEMNLLPWPPDRAVHADMIKLLSLAGPAVVTWDVILDASREGEGDAEMGRAAAIAGRAGVKIITGAVTSPDLEDEETGNPGPTKPLTDVEGDWTQLQGDRAALRPFPELRAESLYGFVDTPPGRDGIRREVPLVVRVGGEIYPSLALQTLMAFFDVPPERVRLRLGDAVYLPTATRGELRVPISKTGRYFVNYRYDIDEHGSDFPAMNYLETLLKLNATYLEKSGTPSMPLLRGGIVFVGQTVTGKADAGPTPRGAVSPLVLVHANLVHNVLHGDYVRRPSNWSVWLAAIAIGYAGLAIGLRRPISVLAVFSLLAAASYLAAAVWSWVEASVWLPLVAPLGGFVALQFWVIGRRVRQEQQGRERVKQMFGSYLSPELLAKMLKEGRSTAVVSSERRPVTILFSDLRDFTSLTERVNEDELIRQLNDYLGAMVECIHREGGTLHKFIGDAVMAVWGDFETEGPQRDAEKACRAALAMQAALADLNASWRAAGRPELRMGIGLNHGTVLIGNIGSPRRMEFAAIGDAVNVASRLEGLNKTLSTAILAGESVHELVAQVFKLRPCGEISVRGKSKPVAVFELLGIRDAKSAG